MAQPFKLFQPDVEPSAPSSSETTVQDVVAAYLDARAVLVKSGRLDARSADKSAYYCRAFAADFGTLAISQCRQADLRRFLTNHPEWKSPHTQTDAVGTVVTCFRFAELEEELIPRCPYRRPRGLIPTPQPRPPIAPEDVEAILNVARGKSYHNARVRFRMAVWFLWHTGCRTCEMRNADWSQVDWVRGVIDMPGKTTRRTGLNRLIPLAPRPYRLLRFLHRWAGKPSNGRIFVNGKGKPWCRWTFGDRFRTHAKRCGVSKNAVATAIRQGFACAALEAGVGERQIADVMGHSTTRLVSWYARDVRQRAEYLRKTAAAVRGARHD